MVSTAVILSCLAAWVRPKEKRNIYFPGNLGLAPCSINISCLSSRVWLTMLSTAVILFCLAAWVWQKEKNIYSSGWLGSAACQININWPTW
jgi:type 1 fimbria pilin